MSITYYLDVKEKSYNVSKNTSVISVDYWCKITNGEGTTVACPYWLTVDGKQYDGYITQNPTFLYQDHLTLKSGEYTINHNNDGTKKVTVKMVFESRCSGGNQTSSKTITLTNIPRASSIAVSGSTLGSPCTFTITKNVSTYTDTITYTCGTASGTVTLDAYNQWTPPLSLASQSTTSKSVSCVFKVTTKNGSTTIGSNTKTVSMTIPSSCGPTFSSIALTDLKNLYSSYGGYVANASQISPVATASGNYGATIASYSATYNSVTKTGSSLYFVPSGEGTQTLTMTVTDSRGYTATLTSPEFTVIPYAVPAINLNKVYRSTDEGVASVAGVYTKVEATSAITKIATVSGEYNAVTYTLKYYDGAAPSVVTTMVLSGFDDIYKINYAEVLSAGDSLIEFSTDKTFYFQIDVSDSISQSSSKIISISPAKAMLDFYKNGANFNIGVGTFAAETGSNRLDVAMDAVFSKAVSVATPTADPHAATKLYVDTKVGSILTPSYTTSSPDGISVASGSWATVAEISVVQGGIYIIQAYARFTSNATGYRSVTIANAKDTDSNDGLADRLIIPAVSGGQTQISVFTVKAATQNKYYLNVYQTSGSKLTVTGRFRVCRIK